MNGEGNERLYESDTAGKQTHTHQSSQLAAALAPSLISITVTVSCANEDMKHGLSFLHLKC